jgi:hypothetical protein
VNGALVDVWSHNPQVLTRMDVRLSRPWLLQIPWKPTKAPLGATLPIPPMIRAKILQLI